MAITIDYIIGDSIAAGIAISGFGLKRSGSYGVKSTDDKGISKVGARPDEILKYLDEIGKTKLKSKNVLLSTGASNNAKDLPTIKKQLEFLKSISARVFIIGVSNNPPSNLPDLKGMNEKLEEIAKSFGYKYLGGFTPSSDGVHPEYGKYFKSNIKPVLDSNEQIEQNQTPANENTTPPGDKTVTEPTPETKKQTVFDENKVFTFNVETQGFVSNKEIGTFSIVPMNPEFDFEGYEEEIPLDDEYVETGFFGNELLPFELQIKKQEETSAEIDKKLTEDDKIGSDNATSGGATKLGGDADFWALVAICSLEDGDDQARADIAQSIYNRVGSGKYGSSMKAVITAKWQYEPAFQKSPRNGDIAPEWKNINSKETAIKALIYSKGWSRDTAVAALKKCFEAIKNASYQSNARSFIGGRTDFLSENQGTADVRNKKDPGRKAIMRQTNRANNVFAWNYNYKKNTVYDAPKADWFNKYASQF